MHTAPVKDTTEEDDRVPLPAERCSWRSMSEVLLGPCPQGLGTTDDEWSCERSFSLFFDCSTFRPSCIAELVVGLSKEPVCQFQAFLGKGFPSVLWFWQSRRSFNDRKKGQVQEMDDAPIRVRIDGEEQIREVHQPKIEVIDVHDAWQ